MNLPLVTAVLFLFFSTVSSPLLLAQQTEPSGCPEVPREDALPSLCVPPTSAMDAISIPAIQIDLTIPEGTPLRVSLDQRTRVAHLGEAVHGKLVEPIYAFDQQVIPAGSTVSGRVTGIDPVSVKVRVLSYSNGNFTPFRKYQVTFDELTLPGGKVMIIKTTTSPGTTEVVHLVPKSKQAEEKRKMRRLAQQATLNRKPKPRFIPASK